jgi:hypothetical protein
MQDVIVAEDFTFAASSAMGDDVTGLGFPKCDAVGALTFSNVDALTSSSLGHWRPALGFALVFVFDRFGVQALLGRPFDHLCPQLFE